MTTSVPVMTERTATDEVSGARLARLPDWSPVFVIIGGAAILGSTILVPRIGPNLVIFEPVVAAVAILGLGHLARTQPPVAVRVFRAGMPWLFVILFASLSSLVGIGPQGWAVANMVQSAYAFVIFFGATAYFERYRQHVDALVLALLFVAAFAVLALAVVPDERVRAPGLFYHGNYAAHFLTGAWLVIVTNTRRWTVRGAATMLLVASVLLTASFGSLLMVGVVGAQVVGTWLWARPGAVVAVLLVLVGAVWYLSYDAPSLQESDVELTGTLSATRLERSGDGRLELWSQAVGALGDHPTGVGPDGLRRRVFDVGKEAHNSYVAYLAERGPLGLVGLLGFGVALWRAARPRGSARLLILAFAAGNLVRETLHYRHMWFLLALAFVLDEYSRDRVSESASVAPGTSP